MSSSVRIKYYELRAAAHTEYSRLLAEHGSAGALALLILLLILWKAYWRAPSAFARAWTASLAAWSLVEMGHAAMRIAAISFIFGLALIRWHTQDAQEDETQTNGKTSIGNKPAMP